MALADVVLIVLIVSLVSAILYAKNRNNKLSECVADINSLAAEKQAAEEKIKNYEDRFSDVFDKEAEVEKLSSEKQSIEAQIADLQRDYKDKKATYDDLVCQVAIYDEEVELAELGFYKPHYDFDDPESYKKEIEDIRRRQRDCIIDIH